MNKFLTKIIFWLLVILLVVWLGVHIIRSVSSPVGVNEASPARRLIEFLLGREPKPSPIIPAPEVTVQIPEGWTNDEIASYLAKTGGWAAPDVLKAAQGKEGYLFPDTYRVFASSTPAEVVQKMLDNFDAKVTPDLRAAIVQQGKTLKDIVIMASIIEKEAGIDYSQGDDRDARIISGIFWNRLKIGQALESDATVAYALRNTKTKSSGLDFNVDSPYNTYKYPGLPPGAISNPGLIAIKAAIYPLASDYYYFLTTPDHQIIYARTYAEHLQNRAKYLK